MARILIIGGSLGGLFAANMLLRDGHDVRVMERAAGSLDGRGAGIVTHPALHGALQRAGLSNTRDLGVSVQGRVVLRQDGSQLDALHMPQVLTSWSRLYSLLKALFPDERYLSATTLTDLHTQNGQVQATVRCAGEDRHEAADLLIACDGIRSSVRAQLAPDVVSRYAGYVAWRGVCDEAVLSRYTLETLFNSFGFGVSAGEQILGYPVAGPGNATASGQRCYNTVWYRGADEHCALIDLMTDADGVHYPQGIPPAKVSWRHVAAMRRSAQALMPPQFAEIVEKTAHPFLQPIHDLASKEIAFGRVALLGDAAFVARPHVGMGVTKAALDAAALSDCIRTHGANEQALKHYAALRIPAGLAVVQRARDLGDHLQANKNLHGSGFGAAVGDGPWVLRHTAVDHDDSAAIASLVAAMP
jgi:2-polyprenyl-6-methoxyphenol hydroxylase-like FAD-dependent oxidoreductase